MVFQLTQILTERPWQRVIEILTLSGIDASKRKAVQTDEFSTILSMKVIYKFINIYSRDAFIF